ncbi:hypothetical protein [Stakelama tenebrarum]|uniref:Uncharacterized protein n=1 Tax=Stakelama tenebrarum TaxID=2711215 RepID=A0A6G6Y6P9_9SPHN|nr:hypothetical protein [Sphingosinithalassobacter tenebrarum]QIG80253.1 hypothetical protein G5C33_11020 [Sphingosinithalassobacter tenebrarum]
MATDPNIYLTVAAAGLIGLAMMITAGLSGWRGWLALKQEELSNRRPVRDREGPAEDNGTVGSRIEIADLKERIRKLEAIAAGVDL